MLAGMSLVGSVAVVVGAVACTTSASPCTPEEHGLGGAIALTPRPLPGRPAVPGECARARIEVLSSDAELSALYEELGINAGATVSDGGAVEYPVVDFSRERVIVREGVGTEAISWAVANGEIGVLGLLSCTGPQAPSCVVNVIAVEAAITRVESRTCDPVRCGLPRPAPVRRR